MCLIKCTCVVGHLAEEYLCSRIRAYNRSSKVSKEFSVALPNNNVNSQLQSVLAHGQK